MKKQIFKIEVLLLLAVLFLVTCGDDPLVKSEVDAKHKVDDPALTISTPTNLTATSVELSTTLSDLENVYEAGFLRSSSEDFKNPLSTLVELGDAQTLTTTIGLAPLTKYFVKAYAITKSGNTVFSDVVTFETPDAPFIDKISGRYRASMDGYWGDSYTSTITIKPHEEEGKVTIENLDPYFFSNGFTAEKGFNTFEASYDEGALTITIQGGQLVGYQAVEITPYEAQSIVLQVKDNGATLSVGDVMWGVYAGGWYELYVGPYDYIKQ